MENTCIEPTTMIILFILSIIGIIELIVLNKKAFEYFKRRIKAKISSLVDRNNEILNALKSVMHHQDEISKQQENVNKSTCELNEKLKELNLIELVTRENFDPLSNEIAIRRAKKIIEDINGYTIYHIPHIRLGLHDIQKKLYIISNIIEE